MPALGFNMLPGCDIWHCQHTVRVVEIKAAMWQQTQAEQDKLMDMRGAAG